MITLYIMRHAKSSWDHPGLEDFQRPLMEKGKKRTKYIIDYLLEHDVKPDLIFSSHAVRAYDTARIVANAVNYPEDRIIISKNIYHGDADSLFNLFYDLSEDVHSVMIVGHNPTLTYFSNYFLDKKLDNLSTSGIVAIEFETQKWNEIQVAQRKTRFVITPKKLKNKISRNKKNGQ